MPEYQIIHGPIIGETPSEILQSIDRQIETQELEFVCAKKVVNVWQRKLMFLSMEQQVAAPAGAEKVEPVHDV